jgi:hypothetical protein
VSHFLLVYDQKASRLLELREFASTRDAHRERRARELANLRDRNVEVVVLTADSEEALRRTHGRYFSSAGELIQRASG